MEPFLREPRCEEREKSPVLVPARSVAEEDGLGSRRGRDIRTGMVEVDAERAAVGPLDLKRLGLVRDHARGRPRSECPPRRSEAPRGRPAKPTGSRSTRWGGA